MRKFYTLLLALLLSASANAQQVQGKKRAAAFTFTASEATHSFSSALPSAGYTYSWSFGDDTPASSQKSPTHTFTRDGVYNVCLTVTDSAGNWDSSCQEVTISSTGIPQHNLSSNLLIYPNPSPTGIVTIDLAKCNVKEVSITVTNITGKTVYERLIKSSHIEKHILDLTQEPSGNYFMTITAGNETITKRVALK